MVRVTLLALAASAGASIAMAAQDVFTSYARARALVDSAVVAHGGRESMGKGIRFAARQEGFDCWRNQSPRAEPPYASEPWTGTPIFEIMADEERVFSGAGPTVEVHNIGPSPHVNEMLVAWLPVEGILFQGDLLNLPATGVVYPNAANLTTAHFAAWIKGRALKVRVLAGVHMPPGTMEQLQEALTNSDLGR